MFGMHRTQKGFGLVGLLFVVLTIAFLLSGSWFVYKSHKGDRLDDLDQSKREMSEPIDSTLAPADEVYHDIETLSLRIKITDDTKDLISRVSGKSVRFSLQSFVERAEQANYPYGEGVCEDLVAVRVFDTKDEVERNEHAVYGELVDDYGNSVYPYLIRMGDGRYALIEAAQSPCGRHQTPGDEYEELQKAEAQVRDTLLNLLTTNLQGTSHGD